MSKYHINDWANNNASLQVVECGIHGVAILSKRPPPKHQERTHSSQGRTQTTNQVTTYHPHISFMPRKAIPMEGSGNLQ